MSKMFGLEKENFAKSASNVDIIANNIDGISKEIVLLSKKINENYDASFSNLFKLKLKCFISNFDSLNMVLYEYKKEMNDILKYYENTEKILNNKYD